MCGSERGYFIIIIIWIKKSCDENTLENERTMAVRHCNLCVSAEKKVKVQSPSPLPPFILYSVLHMTHCIGIMHHKEHSLPLPSSRTLHHSYFLFRRFNEGFFCKRKDSPLVQPGFNLIKLANLCTSQDTEKYNIMIDNYPAVYES